MAYISYLECPAPGPPTPSPVAPDTPAPTETPVVPDTPAPTETPVAAVTPAPTETPVAAVTPAPTHGGTTPSPDAACVPKLLNFNTLTRGEYVTDQLLAEFGVTVSAESDTGYVPGGGARAFDTSNPGGDDGDDDLGSPNEACEGGGPGHGPGGAPDQPFPNCEPQGIVLIIQESDKETPDDNSAGGVISFFFTNPVIIEEFAILDIDGDETPVVKV